MLLPGLLRNRPFCGEQRQHMRASLPAPAMLRHALRSIAGCRRGSAAVEFALCGTAFLGFILGIINLGLLGLDLGALAHGVQTTGRWAAVNATASYASSGSAITEPCLGSVVTAFNGFSAPVLPSIAQPSSSSTISGTAGAGNLSLTASWSSSAGSAPGVYLTLTGTYTWHPLGFAKFGGGIPLTITTAATVIGSSLSGVTVGSSCS